MSAGTSPVKRPPAAAPSGAANDTGPADPLDAADLSKLPPAMARIVELRRSRRLSAAQIAAELGVVPEYVGVALSLARRRLGIPRIENRDRIWYGSRSRRPTLPTSPRRPVIVAPIAPAPPPPRPPRPEPPPVRPRVAPAAREVDAEAEADSVQDSPALVRARVKAAATSRGCTIPGTPLSREERRASALILYPNVERPRTRAECAQMPRPCPWVSCSHHLFLDVNAENGAIKLNFPHLNVWEMKETCSLDIADRGGTTLEAVGAILNLTRERIRQVEDRGLRRVRRQSGEALGITEP